MAIVEKPVETAPLELEGPQAPRRPSEGVFKRPTSTTGWKSWFTTVDHKRVGIMYGASALFFFAVAGLEASLIRWQLARPNQSVLNPDLYNQVYTMHGTTMVFFVVIPIGAAFMNYLIPLQIGARDVAFPRLNAFSFWTFLAGGIFFNLSWFTGGGADCGWFCYAPNSGLTFSEGHGVDFYALGLQIAGLASLVGAINLIVTVINMRAPGMSMLKMPVFTWMAFVVQVMLLFAVPVISIALFLLTFDRLFGANFFNVQAGADPLLWQHLFWIFGHPEVYILILPAFGIVSEIIPTFSRKPLFGYSFVVFSGIAIGFMGWGVWAHHMFASGLGPVSVAAFSATTMFIAVPTGVKILNWVGTMWGGKVRFETPMLYAVALVGMFTIGGLSGVMHSISPSDWQQTDTYFIVAHFHYVLFGGALMGFFGGLYFWWPKVFGYRLDERRGKWQFWVNLIGFNLTFGPMHVLGLQGMPRRYQTYDANIGFELWNMAASIGVLFLAAAFLMLLWNITKSYLDWRASDRPNVGADPWDARSLEWSIPSPTPPHNFDVSPQVEQLDDFWHRKYAEDETGRYKRVATGEELAQKGDGTPHLPSPSYWPLVVSIGLPFIAAGLIFNLAFTAVGALLVIGGIFGWATEPPDAPHDDSHDPHTMAEEAPLADVATAAEHAGGDHHDPHATATGVSNAKLAMWAFLGSDCLLFGALISTYLLLRRRGSGVDPEELFDIPFTSVSAFVLLMSSLTMVLAVAAAHRRDAVRMRQWLLATALLGAIFISGQVYEFTAFYNEGLGYTTNVFGSAFYTLTGFHGVHVSMGILMLVSLFALSSSGRLEGENAAEVVENVGLYWHFVDVVWIVIFTVVYLIP